MWKFLKRKITEKKSHQIWWFLKMTNLKTFHHIKCESSWIGTFLKRNHIIYDSSCQRKEVLETCHVAWQLQPHTTVPWVYCFNIFELQISDFFHFVLCGLRHVMSICRYVDMSICRYVDMSICRCDSIWWQPLFGISGAWSAFFSPQSSHRSAMDTERNSAIWTPHFSIVHQESKS